MSSDCYRQLTKLYTDQRHFNVFVLLCFAPDNDVKVLAVIANVLSACRTESDS